MKGQDYDYVRRYYGVPAARGVRVRFNGKMGTITSSAGAHLRLRPDGETRRDRRWLVHPTWEMVYYDAAGNVIWQEKTV